MTINCICCIGYSSYFIYVNLIYLVFIRSIKSYICMCVSMCVCTFKNISISKNKGFLIIWDIWNYGVYCHNGFSYMDIISRCPQGHHYPTQIKHKYLLKWHFITFKIWQHTLPLILKLRKITIRFLCEDCRPWTKSFWHRFPWNFPCQLANIPLPADSLKHSSSFHKLCSAFVGVNFSINKNIR